MILEMIIHLLFCYFFSTMKGRVYRVTYNSVKGVAEIHLADDTVKSVSMTQDEWTELIHGNIEENIKRYLDE